MMNKKILPFIFIASSVLCISGCGKKEEVPEQSSVSVSQVIETIEEEADEPFFVPEISRIKAICELSTVKCIYHNVAYGVQYAGTGLSHVGEKERKFMQEYDSEVEISYPVDKIRMTIDGTEIHITLPEPDINTRKIPESITESSYVEEPDNEIQKNPIRADTISRAVTIADATMMEDIMNHSSLLNTAENQAKYLIENYIRQIGSLTGVEYKIVWDEDPSLTSE